MLLVFNNSATYRVVTLVLLALSRNNLIDRGSKTDGLSVITLRESLYATELFAYQPDTVCSGEKI